MKLTIKQWSLVLDTMKKETETRYNAFKMIQDSVDQLEKDYRKAYNEENWTVCDELRKRIDAQQTIKRRLLKEYQEANDVLNNLENQEF